MITHPTGARVRRATQADVAGIVRLLDAAFDPGGRGLSQRFTAPQVAGFVAAFPCIAAAAAGADAGADAGAGEGAFDGVLLAQPLPVADELGPVTAAMLRAFPPPPGAFVYGPIAVAPWARGTGLARDLAGALLRHLPGRVGVLFVNAVNGPSLRTHRAMGFREEGGFTYGGTGFRCFTCRADGPPEPG